MIASAMSSCLQNVALEASRNGMKVIDDARLPRGSWPLSRVIELEAWRMPLSADA